MARCTATKQDGTRCTLEVMGKQPYCWAHDPRNAEQRRRRAAKGGRGKAQRVTKELHRLLEELTQQVIDGTLETSRGAVANQLISTRIRLMEHERKMRELGEIEERIEALERSANGRVGKQWGYTTG